jgi:hypothetical protein
MSDRCPECGFWFMPNVYHFVDEEYLAVPFESAPTIEAARQHLLLDAVDWSGHEDMRRDVESDWRYEGIYEVKVCEHPIDEPHRLNGRRRPGCNRKVNAHRFAFDPSGDRPDA